MRRNRIVVGGVAGLLVAVLVVWCGMPGGDRAPGPDGSSAAPERPRRPGDPPSPTGGRGVPAHDEAVRSEHGSAVEAAYDVLAPHDGRVRCTAGPHLEDGLYDARSPTAGHVLVRGGVLTATVTEPDGSSFLENDLVRQAQLSWVGGDPGSWGSCRVRPLEWVEVSGTLHTASGEPVVDHEVRGCRHGDFARTDAAGAWRLTAAAGTTCHPMAFVETPDGRFGKSNVVDVVVEAPGPVEGVALVLPDDGALWDQAYQVEMASQLATMISGTFDAQRADLEASRRALGEVDGEGRRVVETLVAHDAAFLERVDAAIERLDDPEERLEALRDMWLGLY